MSRASRPLQSSATDLASSVSAFLRALADRAQTDPALAAQLHAALRESGLLPTEPAPSAPLPARARGAHSAGPTRPAPTESPVLDPFAVLRAHGESGLRSALDPLDIASLRQIVRLHRLDPARISARWSARDRVITLIVEQVRARADHGKAFSRV